MDTSPKSLRGSEKAIGDPHCGRNRGPSGAIGDRPRSAEDTRADCWSACNPAEELGTVAEDLRDRLGVVRFEENILKLMHQLQDRLEKQNNLIAHQQDLLTQQQSRSCTWKPQ